MIINLTSKDTKHIALIHSTALEGDFLPSLGFNFLNTFYSGVILKDGVYGFGFEDKGKVVGFVLGTRDSVDFFSLALKSKLLKLSFFLCLQIIKNPLIVKNVLETFFYTSKDKGPKAELIVIAVKQNYQGKGIGKKLTQALEGEFVKNNIPEYKLTVHADKAAVQFYEHLKYSKISSFNLYDKLWYVYSKKIKGYGKTSKRK